MLYKTCRSYKESIRYCRFRNLRENLNFAKICEIFASQIVPTNIENIFLGSYFSKSHTHLRIKELANNLKLKKLRKKDYKKISESIVFDKGLLLQNRFFKNLFERTQFGKQLRIFMGE